MEREGYLVTLQEKLAEIVKSSFWMVYRWSDQTGFDVLGCNPVPHEQHLANCGTSPPLPRLMRYCGGWLSGDADFLLAGINDVVFESV